MRRLVVVAFLLMVAGPAAAETFTEDFEGYFLAGFHPETVPEQDWYTYTDLQEIGTVSNADPIVGTQSLVVASEQGVSTENKFLSFDLETPATLSSTTFHIEGTTISENGVGSNQYVSLQSSSPRRTLVEFYVFCQDAAAPGACELRVRFDHIDSTGQVLVPTSSGQKAWKIEVRPDWFDAEFQLLVDDVDDGVFPFMELPANIQRLKIAQYSPSTPLDASFDDWTVVGAVTGSPTVVEGDAANGIKNFLANIHFTSTGSKFAFGVVLYIVLLAAVISPLLVLGMDNTVIPTTGLYATLCALWLVKMEIWPDWIGVLLIIVTGALISMSVRRFILGIRDASKGPGLVAGSLGYFIICSTLLAMSGYAGENVALPVEDLAEDGETEGLNETETVTQSWGMAVVDCSIGIISFGKLGDCTRETEGKAVTWAKETIDSIGRVTAKIWGYARAAVTYLFQLLTFQLPIPVVFNMMIVLPPAAALATLAIQTIRGTA